MTVKSIVKTKVLLWLKRQQLLLTVVVMVASVVTPFLKFGIAQAALVTTRSIAMSSSAASATGTSYKVSFNLISTGALQGIVVDFCGNDPIIGDTTCTLPTGFSISASPAVSGQSTTAGCSLATFTTVGQLNTNRTLTLTAASAITVTSPPCAASFTITTVTNPSAVNTTFYARIYTYATAAGATGYTVAAGGGAYVDAGGIALSTAAQIVVTAKVQEQLSFCVYTLANCGAGGTTVTLGTNGVLSTSASYTDINTRYDIQTNATGGAAVYVKGGLLTSGSNTIPALTTAATYTAGTSEFGICTWESSGTNLTPYTGTTLYSGGTSGLCSGATTGSGTDHAALYYFGTNAISGTYGDEIANEVAGTTSTGTIPMMAGVSNTQVAGIYTTTLTFIAVGTY
jgi:hypothetical protein